MGWYFVKFAYVSYATGKTQMGSLIVNYNPSEIYDTVNIQVNGGNIEIVNIVKL